MSVLSSQDLTILRRQLRDTVRVVGTLGDQCSFLEIVKVIHEIVLGAEGFDILQQLFPGDVAQGVLEGGAQVVEVSVDRPSFGLSCVLDIGRIGPDGGSIAGLRSLLPNLLTIGHG